MVIPATAIATAFLTWLTVDSLYGGPQLRETQGKVREMEAIAAQQGEVIRSVQSLVCPVKGGGR